MKYRQHSLRSLLSVLLCAILLGAAGAGHASRKSKSEMSEPSRKARYFYLQGALREASGDVDQAYEFYKKAYSLDSTHLASAYMYGVNRLGLPLDIEGDYTEADKSLAIARKAVDAYPADFFPAYNYAVLAGMLENTEESVRVFELLDSLHPENTVSLIYLAEAYASTSDIDKAIKALNKYERAEGASSAITLRKAALHLYNNDTIGAMAEADRLIESNPVSAEYVLLKGKLYQYLNMPDSAFRYLVEAERLDPGSGEVKETLANYYSQKGDSAAYYTKTYEALMCEDIVLRDKVGILASFLQDIVNKKADTARGDTLFNNLSDQYPHEPLILSLSGRYNAAKGDYNAAIDDMRYAKDLDPSNEEYWVYLMMYLYNGNREDEAFTTFDEMAHELPEVPIQALLLHSDLARQKGYTDMAVADVDTLIKRILPGYSADMLITDSTADKSVLRQIGLQEFDILSNYYQMAGDIYYAAKPPRLDDAFRCYETSLFFNPDNSLTLNNYAYFIAEKDDIDPESDEFKKAKEMSEKSIKLDPESSTFYDTYAWILFRAKDYKEALEYQKAALEKAEKEGLTSADFFSHLGDILFMNGDVEGALTNWEKALKMTPDDALLKKKINHKTFFYN